MPFDAKEELILIGEQLRQARKEQKQTQCDIARRVGVGKMTISGLEAGKSNSFDNIGKLAEQMGYDLKLVPRSEDNTKDFEILEHDEQILIAKEISTDRVMVFNIDKTTLDYGLFTKEDPEPEEKERFKTELLKFIKKSIINQ